MLTRGLLVTVMVLIAGRAVNVWLDWILLRRPAGGSRGASGPAGRAEPLPPLWVAGITAAARDPCWSPWRLIAQAWGVDVLGWIAGDAGRAVPRPWAGSR